MDRFVNDSATLEGANAGGPPAPVLREVTGFGSNPGNLRMHLFVPKPGRRLRPLVIVLHGCSQTVDSYDRASGWTRLAVAHDFLVLMPEQQTANNHMRCFSWFEPADTRRGSGEVFSIHEMIRCAVDDHEADPTRIFICGLSAGGAMACALLAAYPEIFVGGAIIAGLPYGAATNVPEAIESMQTGRIKEARTWGDAIRTASDHKCPWPSVAIWHGTADNVVKPINAGELIKQWINVHGLGAEEPAEDRIGEVTRRVWRDAKGRPCVSDYSVPGLGHGAPVDDADPPAPFFLPAGISSTRVIARDWGLTQDAPRRLVPFVPRLAPAFKPASPGQDQAEKSSPIRRRQIPWIEKLFRLFWTNR